ncbi:MAG: glycosyltransferase [Acidimicrobiia bacterium]
MRVLHVINSLAGSGGAERGLVREIVRLEPSIDQQVVRLFEQDDLDQQLLERNIPVVALGLRSRRAARNWPLATWKVYRIILRFKPDVVHTSLFTGNLVGQLAAWMARVPVVSTMTLTGDIELHRRYQPGASSWRAALLRWVAARTAKLGDVRYRALTHDAMVTNCRTLRFPQERVTIIPRGVETGDWASAKPDRSRFGLPDSVPMFVNVGRQVAQKGQVLLLDGFEKILEAVPNAHLAIVGREGDASIDIRREIRERGLSGFVHPLGYRSDVPVLLASSDVFVFSSLAEGFGTAILEAMGAGLPVVAFDIPPVREVTDDGRVAGLVATGDAGALARVAVALLEGAERNAMVASATRWVAEHFAIDDVANQVEDYLRRVCELARRGDERAEVSPENGGAVFVLPISSGGRWGPSAPWITTAGWAAAAQRRWGGAWIVTPEGRLSPEEARDLATRPPERTKPRLGRWRRLVPQVVTTGLKDIRSRREARRFRDEVLAEGWDPSAVGFVWQRQVLFHTAGIDLARRCGVPSVLSVHAPLVREAASWGIKRPGWASLLERVGERPQLKAADVVACVSEEVAAAVTDQGVPEDKIAITPNAVDPDHFRPTDPEERLRGALGLDGMFVVGWSGSFRRFHGVDTAVRAVADLQDELRDLALLLVGSGYQQRKIQEVVDELGVRRAIFTGTVPYRELPRYINLMDVALVLASGTEFHYSPLKLREYMACGRAVVAPLVGEATRLLREGVDALLVEPGNKDELVRAVRRLYEDDELRTRLGIAARDLAVREFSWDRPLEAALQALERVRSKKT